MINFLSASLTIFQWATVESILQSWLLETCKQCPLFVSFKILKAFWNRQMTEEHVSKHWMRLGHFVLMSHLNKWGSESHTSNTIKITMKFIRTMVDVSLTGQSLRLKGNLWLKKSKPTQGWEERINYHARMENWAASAKINRHKRNRMGMNLPIL